MIRWKASESGGRFGDGGLLRESFSKMTCSSLLPTSHKMTKTNEHLSWQSISHPGSKAAPHCHLHSSSTHFILCQQPPKFLRLISSMTVRGVFSAFWRLYGCWAEMMFLVIYGLLVSACLLLFWAIKGSLISLFFCSTVRPLLFPCRLLSFPSCRSPSVESCLFLRRTPASVPTLASLTASMAPRHVAGRRRWMSTATRCTSATILMRRYKLHRIDLLCLHVFTVVLPGWWGQEGVGWQYCASPGGVISNYIKEIWLNRYDIEINNVFKKMYRYHILCMYIRAAQYE